tara:strand:- start:202 stop:957 length:756 start_codon:yes stop_codon:yes gene_type:complete
MSSRGFLFDLNGVFYEDNKVLDGAIEIINLLREKKIPFRFISNNTTLSRRFFIKKLNEIGLNILNEEIFTANYAGYLIAKKLKLKNCRLILNKEGQEDYEPLIDNKRKIDGIVIGDIGNKWNYELMNQLMKNILDGARIIALHEGKYFQSKGELQIDCGAFVKGLEYVTGKKAIVVGKPSESFFKLAISGWNFKDISIVGDDIYNDIWGGKKMGFSTYLVKTGKFREDIFKKSKISPDYCIESIQKLKDFI